MARLLHITCALILLLCSLPTSSSESGASDCVILLHGMGRTKWSMVRMASHLEDAGYRVWNQSYPSTEQPVEQMAAPHIEAGLEACRAKPTGAIHFVTHSLGGIMIRYYLQDHPIDELGRIVMLAPPNQGSEVTDSLRDTWFYQSTTGPAGQQLGTEPDSLPNSLAPIDAEIGVITGRRTSDPWFSPIIPGEDDGKVSVESARLEEMDDFLVMDAGHTFIMSKGNVIDQVIHFLREGQFDHPEEETP